MIKFKKPAGEVMNFAVGWKDPRGVISSSTWIVPSPLVKVREQHDKSGLCTVWLGGGKAGDRVVVTNRIKTTEGGKGERGFLIVVR